MAAFNAYGYNNNPYMTGTPVYNGYSQNPYLNTPPVMPQPVQQVAQPQTPQQPQQQPQEQLTNGGFIVVPNEDEIIKYPVAPGNCVTFRLENQPVIIEKSMSRSQFDAPHYERYKLVKEEMQEKIQPIKEKPSNETIPDYALASDLESVKHSVENVSARINKLKERLNKAERRLADSVTIKSKLTQEEDEDI